MRSRVIILIVVILCLFIGCKEQYEKEIVTEYPAVTDGSEFYTDGIIQRHSKNYIQAADLFRKAALLGHADAQAALGVCYQNGEGVFQDYAEAVKWYKMSAEQLSGLAMNNLGNCYASGWGVRQDLREAYFWYSLAALDGNSISVKYRDLISSRLSYIEVEQIRNRAKIWFDEHHKPLP